MAVKRYATVGSHCVACGCCVKVCPMGAMEIWKGIVANIDIQKCIGCGKCEKECPAGTILLQDREAIV